MTRLVISRLALFCLVTLAVLCGPPTLEAAKPEATAKPKATARQKAVAKRQVDDPRLRNYSAAYVPPEAKVQVIPQNDKYVPPTAPDPVEKMRHELKTLPPAVRDLAATFGDRYPKSESYLERAEALSRRLEQSTAPGEPNPAALDKLRADLDQLRADALLSNPLLDLKGLLLVKRKPNWRLDKSGKPFFGSSPGNEIGMPSNHECNSSVPRDVWDNEIAVLSPVRPDGKLSTLYRPSDSGFVGEIDLSFDGQRMLFTKSDADNWKVFEIGADGSGLRQVSQTPTDVDMMDPCYLPNGQVMVACTACMQSVPCWHGLRYVATLYVMNADGSGVRQLCFDQDHNHHPTVIDNGQVIYTRWEYTGMSHIWVRNLMVMNPDGTSQRAIYGSNSYFPNSLYFTRQLPGQPGKFVSILTGYHGPQRMGHLVVLDTNRSAFEDEGVVQRISGLGQKVERKVFDHLTVNDWPKFLHPYPLSDKYYLVAGWLMPDRPWGIYLADAFDNLVLVREEPGYALLEPVPLKPQTKPPVIPEQYDPKQKDAVIYLHDVYRGPGLAGVPRGAVKGLRVYAYEFGYPGLAGPSRIGLGGPWEVARVIGTTKVEEDGSAMFRVPAKTALAVQALDSEGAALQGMRTWFAAQPGEQLSCVGCHERPADAATVGRSIASNYAPRELTPWHGPPRGFDFAREVQPVLDKYCVSCHDGATEKPDLRREELVKDYRGVLAVGLSYTRLHPKIMEDTQGYMRFTPAYEALVHYIRRTNVEDDVSLLPAGHYHPHTSELVQMLRKGHQGVELDAESWDRLLTWIDLNAPCHGTWNEVYPVPDCMHERRMELRRMYDGAEGDPEQDPRIAADLGDPVPPKPLPAAERVTIVGWPIPAAEAARRQRAVEPWEKTLDVDGVPLRLVRIPAGDFVLGDADGERDEQPMRHVRVERPFWMAACEITNEQYAHFDPTHSSHFFNKRHAWSDDQGLPLDGPKQPVVRVSWNEAMAFCRWLSSQTGLKVSLPSEAQWEYACRAGSDTPLSYGSVDTDFSPFANVGDLKFSLPSAVTAGIEQAELEGAALADKRFDDGMIVSAAVGSYRPNAWGLFDMHGNAAEWTRATYTPAPGEGDEARYDAPDARRVVRGGSFTDRPERCRSSFRLEFPRWQKVYNVGFRVVVEE
ncbi:MAG: SUMF1/EgtB/PvdO family nonheme iron enzyme [Planctomycetota bacterium]